MNEASSSPILTVVIPTFRRRKELSRAIDSLRQPGCERIEVVISDNASPDNTPDYVAALQTPFAVRYHRNESNVGICENLFRAAKAATTRYQMWMTDDDYVLPGALQKSLQVLEANPHCGYVFSHVHSIRDDQPADATPLMLHGPSTSDQRIDSGLDALKDHARYGWAYSRQILRTDWIDWEHWRRHVNNAYTPVIVSGRIMLRHPAYYHAESIVAHTVYNVRHWEDFGDDDFAIKLRTQADYRETLPAILDDVESTRPVRTLLHRWRVGCEEKCLELIAPKLRQMSFSDGVETLTDSCGLTNAEATRMALRSRSKLVNQIYRYRGKRYRRDYVEARYIDPSQCHTGSDTAAGETNAPGREIIAA